MHPIFGPCFTRLLPSYLQGNILTVAVENTGRADVDVTVQSSRMKNILTRADQRGEAWNVHEWDLAS